MEKAKPLLGFFSHTSWYARMIIPIQTSQLQCCPLNRENLANLTDWRMQSLFAASTVYSAHKLLNEYPQTHDLFYRQVAMISLE